MRLWGHAPRMLLQIGSKWWERSLSSAEEVLELLKAGRWVIGHLQRPGRRLTPVQSRNVSNWNPSGRSAGLTLQFCKEQECLGDTQTSQAVSDYWPALPSCAEWVWPKERPWEALSERRFECMFSNTSKVVEKGTLPFLEKMHNYLQVDALINFFSWMKQTESLA